MPLAAAYLHLSPVPKNAAGLDQALLGNAVQTGDKSKDDQHIHDLVKLGAHLLVRLPAWLASSLLAACCVPVHARGLASLTTCS